MKEKLQFYENAPSLMQSSELDAIFNTDISTEYRSSRAPSIEEEEEEGVGLNNARFVILNSS
jgi:hypothetical protein